MARGNNKRISKGKKINPTFYVFCEGESEKEYVNLLKRKYRIPIEIKSKVEGSGITERSINNFKKQSPTHSKDQTFLIYDMDVPVVVERLSSIKNVNLILSNPCFELWLLLHYKDQKGEYNCTQTESQLNTISGGYSKGRISSEIKVYLEENSQTAIIRAKGLVVNNNPFTGVYLLLEELDGIKKSKK